MPSDDELNCIREAAAFINNYQNPKGEKDLMMSWLTDLKYTAKRISKEIKITQAEAIADFISIFDYPNKLEHPNQEIANYFKEEPTDVMDLKLKYYLTLSPQILDLSLSNLH